MLLLQNMTHSGVIFGVCQTASPLLTVRLCLVLFMFFVITVSSCVFIDVVVSSLFYVIVRWSSLVTSRSRGWLSVSFSNHVVVIRPSS